MINPSNIFKCYRYNKEGHIARYCQENKELVGSSNECNVKINNINSTALLDTGSCISTIGHTFYQTYLSDIELKPVKKLLKIECADSKELPYFGYIETTNRSTDGIPELQN